MPISIVKFIQYCLLASLSFVLVILFGVIFEELKNGETWIGSFVILVVLVVSYLFLFKWIAKYDISGYGVYFVLGMHLMVLTFLLFLPLDIFLGEKIRESYGQRVYQGSAFLVLIISYFIHRKWDIILIMRKRYYQPSAYSKADWYMD
jgi:hypothetical protein